MERNVASRVDSLATQPRGITRAVDGDANCIATKHKNMKNYDTLTELAAATLAVCEPLFRASDGGAMWCAIRDTPGAKEKVARLETALHAASETAQSPIPAPVRTVARASGAGAGKEAHKAARRMPDAQKQAAAWRAGLGSPADWMSDRELRYFAERKNPNGCLVCEREANARLIAAAPALLRGCQAALAYLADPPSEFAENRAAAVELIRAALAAVTESEGA